jgi:stress response protein SCP2
VDRLGPCCLFGDNENLVIIVKLQRVKANATTLLIKVKVHRGYPLNEESDIRAEMGRMKQEQEKTWSTSTNSVGSHTFLFPSHFM